MSRMLIGERDSVGCAVSTNTTLADANAFRLGSVAPAPALPQPMGAGGVLADVDELEVHRAGPSHCRALGGGQSAEPCARPA